MRIRQYQEADLEALQAIHARQGFEYRFPDINDRIFVSKIVLEDERGRISMASLARLTCEMYLLVDPDAGTPRQRYQRLIALHEAGRVDVVARGLDDAHAWIPPSIARRFGRRLEVLGWVRDDFWTPYCTHLHD
jgi:hypothetical protein